MLKARNSSERPVGAIEMRGVRLAKDSAPIGLRLDPGSCWAVMGPDPTDAPSFLNVLSGAVRPASGTVDTLPCAWSGVGSAPRRTLQYWAKKLAGPGGETRIAESLLACRLWDDRSTPIQKLPPAKLLRAGLLPLLLTDSPLKLAGQSLDVLDPWVLPGVMTALKRGCESGAVLVASTQRPDVAEALGGLLVLRSGGLVFQGSVDELRDSMAPATLQIETPELDTARSIVEPFAIDICESKDGLIVRAREGQALAARLLLEGYGSVRSVVIRRATIEEALNALIDDGARRRPR